MILFFELVLRTANAITADSAKTLDDKGQPNPQLMQQQIPAFENCEDRASLSWCGLGKNKKWTSPCCKG
jgi:hypothetical protein